MPAGQHEQEPAAYGQEVEEAEDNEECQHEASASVIQELSEAWAWGRNAEELVNRSASNCADSVDTISSP
jgi:hypothetical protein